MYSFFKKHQCACFGIGCFFFAILIVFFSVLPRYSGLIAPDSPPFFPEPFRTDKLGEMLTRGVFTPHYLYWLVFGGLYGHELTYILDTFLLVLGGVYYLRAQRVSPLAAWFGGLALGLCGYTFTLFSAGHRGYFHMFPCSVWVFGFIARAFETQKLIYFALIGLVFAWGAPHQPDVLLLVGALAAGYVLWRTFAQSGDCGDRKSEIYVAVLRVWPKFAISLLVLALAGFASMREAVTTQVANRDAQIMGASGKTVEVADGKKTERTPEEERERWLFATGWSLPPEDVLEFIVPGVFGNDSVYPPYPYWGRLGRPDDSVFQKGMMINYRQHTVYLGLIPVLFAVFAVWAWGASRRKDGEGTAARLTDMPFWCTVWVVCLLLAFGRYTPVYRLFYAIPYMDYIRAPVKFLHLVEIATAFMAGFGMNAFLRNEPAVQRRRLLWLGVGMTALLLVGAVAALMAKPSVVRHITELGMGQLAETLGGYTVRNVMRAVAYAALATAAVFLAVRNTRENVAVMASGMLMALLVLDQSLVARRYVRVIDLEPRYRENAVVKALKKNAGGQVANVVNYATQSGAWQDWFGTSLSMNGIRNLVPSQDELREPYGQMFLGLQKDPARLWQALQAQAVIVPRQSAEGFFRSGVLRPLLDFELGAGVVRQVQQPGEKTLSLARVARTMDSPRFVADWQGDVPLDKQVDAVVGGTATVSDAPQPADGGNAEEAKVEVMSMRGLPWVFSTRVKVSAKSGGLLVFNERLSDKQEILIDGQPVPKHTADAIWPAALIPAGEHEVVLRVQRQPVAFALSLLAAFAVLGWGLCTVLGDRRARHSGH